MKYCYILIASTLLLFSCASTKVQEPLEKVEEVSETEDIEIIEQTPEILEYERYTLNVDISYDEFNSDKNRILQIIDEMNEIIEKRDYNAWVTYLDMDSAVYWSKRPNLQKAASKLPVKGIKLQTLHDYFIYVFLQSRKGYTVDEIRYENRNLVKAVQVAQETDIVYYTFKKINDEWKLHLPELTN